MKQHTYYTDGSCVGNGSKHAKAAWAWICKNTAAQGSGLVDGKQSNNTAELTAILEALKHASDGGCDEVTVYSDSQYAINCIAGDWKRKKNVELFNAIDAMALNFTRVHFEWVRGHGDDPLNEQCDELARTVLVRHGVMTAVVRPNYSFSL